MQGDKRIGGATTREPPGARAAANATPGKHTRSDAAYHVVSATTVSPTLRHAIHAALHDAGAGPAQVASAWTAVQRGTASAYGAFYDAVGAVQRNIYAYLDSAEQREA